MGTHPEVPRWRRRAEGMQIQEESRSSWAWTKRRAKAGGRLTACLISPLLSLTLAFPQGVIHVDNKAGLLLFHLFWMAKPLVFIFFILVLWDLIVPVAHSLVLLRPSLKSPDLWQVRVTLPKFWRPHRTPDGFHLPLPFFKHTYRYNDKSGKSLFYLGGSCSQMVLGRGTICRQPPTAGDCWPLDKHHCGLLSPFYNLSSLPML